MATRHKNYWLARARTTQASEADELPWVRIPGLAALELPRPVVLINGAFDLLHSGHMKIIAAARDKATDKGTLVCGLDSDTRVAKNRPLDSVSRPILSWIERATSLGFMPIDFLVEISSDPEFTRLLAAIKPDLRVQGSDYRDQTSKHPAFAKMFVMDHSNMRTSKIIDRILKHDKTSTS